MLDQAVAVIAVGTLIAYAVHTVDSEPAQYHHRMMLTIPVVADAVFRYFYLLYLGNTGGAPETMLLADRPLLASAAAWGGASVPVLFWASSDISRGS